MRRLREASFAAGCVIATGAAAMAAGQPVAGTLNAFGFFGTWAVQCGAPPAPANIVETVAWTGREPVDFTATAAPGAAGNRYRIVSAQMPNPTTLYLQVELNNRGGESLTIVKSGDNRIRTMATQTAQGFLVKEGIIAANGRETPWLQKCR